MNQLIQITKNKINGAEVNSVNSRDIYRYLQLAQGQYSRWIKIAIEKYSFSEGYDYICFDMYVEGIKAKTYFVTIEMAKELCMVSNSDRGKEVRKYFIDIEKQHKQVAKIPKNQLEALSMFLEVSTEHEHRLSKLEDTKRLENWQEKSLQDVKNQKVYEIADDNPVLAQKLHRKVWSLFKKEFHLPRYNELPAIKYEDGVSYINNLTLADMVG